MKLLLITFVLIVVAFLAFFLFTQKDNSTSQTIIEKVDQNENKLGPEATTQAVITEQNKTSSKLDASQRALLDDPKVIEYLKQLDQDESFRESLENIESIDAQQAEELIVKIKSKESELEITAAESSSLQLAIMKKVLSDDEYNDFAKKLIEQKSKEADAYQQKHLQSLANDSKYQDYKAREKKVVEEVLSMDTFPDGLSQDEYLRQRLDEITQEIYQQHD
jgi:hypothetical protein